MEFSIFYTTAKQIFSANDNLPPLTENAARKLYQLTEIMLTANKTMNLTAIKDEKDIILKHYVDSLAICAHIPADTKVIDVGCGAGFPTLPLAIFRPDLQITALDSTAKRIEYAKNTALALGLSNVSAITGRAEELAKSVKLRECFDVATARAVAALPILSELCLPFVKVGGYFIAMKAQRARDELSAAENAVAKCGGKVDGAVCFELNNAEGTCEARALIKISKTSHTPNDLPRQYSKILKKPL